MANARLLGYVAMVTVDHKRAAILVQISALVKIRTKTNSKELRKNKELFYRSTVALSCRCFEGTLQKAQMN